MSILKLLVPIALGTLIVWSSCTKTDEDERPNPFLNQNTGKTPVDSLNPATIQGLHQYIFSPRCANPTCHDGTFEPDFRTVTSTYYSMVYHPVTKNDSKGSFTYRVLPGNHKKSWLVERLITNDPVLGRMPLYANPLSETEMKWVRTWIDSGARDINGLLPKEPNAVPQISYRAVFDKDGKRLDTVLYPGSRFIMKLPPNTMVTLAAIVQDDKTPVKDLKPNYFKFSYDRNFFDNAPLQQAYFLISTWVVTFNTSDYLYNRQVFFRFYTNDGALPTETEFPNNESNSIIQDVFSFYVAD